MYISGTWRKMALSQWITNNLWPQRCCRLFVLSLISCYKFFRWTTTLLAFNVFYFCPIIFGILWLAYCLLLWINCNIIMVCKIWLFVWIWKCSPYGLDWRVVGLYKAVIFFIVLSSRMHFQYSKNTPICNI